MTYAISSSLLARFPQFQRGVIIAQNVDNTGECPELLATLEQQISIIEDEECALMDPRLLAWDQTYETLGLNPRKDTPSICFLIKQIKKGKRPKHISPLVDCFNTISLKYRLPCGGDDLGVLRGGDLLLDFATGAESFTPLFRPEVTEHPEAGEVIYVTPLTNRVMCRRWNWRNGYFSRITSTTSDVVINLDGLIPPVTKDFLTAATEELAEMVARFCGAAVRTATLNSDTPIMTL